MKRRTLIELAVAALLLAGVIGAYVFWYAAVRAQSETTTSLDLQIQAKSREEARVENAKQTLASLAVEEASMRAYLVRQEDIVTFLGGLESTGAALGSTVEVVSVSADTSGVRGRIVLSLKVTGSFDAVLRTLGSIEYGPYDSAVERVTFDTVPSESEEAGAWTAAATFAFGTDTASTTTP